MNHLLFWNRCRWIYLPASLLSLLLQRAPMVAGLMTAESRLGNPINALLRSAFTVAAVGGYHALAGATQLATNPATPATATVGSVFAMVFSVTGAPANAASYEVRGVLPPGLSIPGLSGDLLNAQNGTISGTPTTAGSFSLSIRAWNTRNKQGQGGSPTFTLQINVQPAAVAEPPTFTVQPTGQAVTAGGQVTLTALATGSGSISYQWSKDGAVIAGATSPNLTLTNVTAAAAGSYLVIATNSAGSNQSNTANLTVNAATPPTIVTQPLTQVVVVGARLALTVDVTGTGPLAYQWRKGGLAIAGATAESLTLGSVQAADAGEYQVSVSNAFGATVSSVATLGVTTTVSSAMTNVAVRTTLAAEQLLIVGFTMTGGSKPLLVRAVGPGLAAFGVAGVMPDPRLALFDGGTSLAANDNWGGGAVLSTAFASVGAFALPANSLDAALLRSIEGGRTAQISGAQGGNVIVEAYDGGRGLSPRLTNVSARNRVGTGADVLIAGFTISGSTPKTVLIRGVGPTLAAFQVPNVLADPKIEVFSGTTKIAENDTWSPSQAATFASVGAFALTPAGKDAALVLSLAPGGYTVQVSGADGGTGEALVELYEVQP